MKIIERMIQRQKLGTELDLEKEKEWNAVESRAGFPPNRVLRCIAGELEYKDIIIEREWESMAAMEAAYERVMRDPEWQALMSEVSDTVDGARFELYTQIA